MSEQGRARCPQSRSAANCPDGEYGIGCLSGIDSYAIKSLVPITRPGLQRLDGRTTNPINGGTDASSICSW